MMKSRIIQLFTESRELTDEQRLQILGHAKEEGLSGWGGECGEVAIAINELLFGGRGQLVAAINVPMWKIFDRLVGHVGVRDANGSIWDADGTYDDEEDKEEFRAWGMVDPDDDDFDVSEEEAYEAEIVEMSKEQVRQSLSDCSVRNPYDAIKSTMIKLGFLK